MDCSIELNLKGSMQLYSDVHNYILIQVHLYIENYTLQTKFSSSEISYSELYIKHLPHQILFLNIVILRKIIVWGGGNVDYQAFFSL